MAKAMDIEMLVQASLPLRSDERLVDGAWLQPPYPLGNPQRRMDSG